MIMPSNRGQVEPFRVMDVVAKAGRMIGDGRDVIMMCVGQPSAPAPSTARNAAATAIANGRIGYTASGGIAALRERIARHYQDKYGVSIEPERVVVTTGSSGGFVLAFLSMFDTSERVAIPSPGYPAYRNILKALSLEPVEIDTDAASRWVLTPEMLETAHREKPLAGLLVANPNNPNGTMMRQEAFDQLLEKSRELGISFISDEIYHGLTYGITERTALSSSQDVIVINSFSKYFCMTGWRIGWMIVPQAMVETVTRLQQNVFICAPEISQIAALHAFDGVDELEKTKAGYIKNRDYLLEHLPKLGFREIQPADGAFYAYADVSAFTNDSEEFCRAVLEQAQTAITPGTDFDTKRGKAWVRISFAGSYDDMQKGVERLGGFLK